jgi:putative membrane-bound dehydrogenase-like protein
MRRLALFLLFPQAVLAAEVNLHRWSGSLNVPDPVACTVDEKGRVYVTSTTRRKVADLDIREHPMWIADDVGLSSVDEKRAFLKRELAPGRLRQPRGGLKDHNKDGSIDWKDLTVHSERIYQLRDTDGDGTADQQTVFAEGFQTEVTGIAAGILYHEGWVYATIAPDLWRLKDTNDDGVADVREVIAHGFGIHLAYAGHDMHGPRLGPDGRIYWSIGDKGVNVTSKDGKHWYYPHEGAVMRVEPDGTGFEVFAHGLRNVQEVAFDDFGNLFGVDNDADMPGEKERMVYITERSDSGWRCAHQYMKAESRWMRENLWKAPYAGNPLGQTLDKKLPKTGTQAPLFFTPPLANYSNGPAGLVHEPGTALGARLKGHFILNQFPSGKMEAFTMKQEGASFAMSRARIIHAGIMGIGLSFGLDGALYTADWVGGYPLDEKGAIWRIDEPAPHPQRRETKQWLSQNWTKASESELQELLAHADQRVRVAAQLELARRKAWTTLASVLNEPSATLMAKIHALWGLGMGMRRGQIDDKLLDASLATEDTELQTQLSKVLGDAPQSAGIKSRQALISWLSSVNPRVAFHAAIATGKMAIPEANEALWKLAAKAGQDAWLRHAVVTGLAGAVSVDALTAALQNPERNERICATLALARLHSPQITQALQSSDSAIVDEAARAIHDDASIPEALPALAKLVETHDKLSPITRSRALNANLRLGQIEHAQRLLHAALAGSDEAFAALHLFANPPVLDRVDGVHRRHNPRNSEAIASVIQPHVPALLSLKNPIQKAAGIELMIIYQLKVNAVALSQIIGDAKAVVALRVEALRLMAAQHAKDPTFPTTLVLAAGKNSPQELRMEALVQTFAHQKERAVAEASRVLEQGSLLEKQAALKLVGRSQEIAAQQLMDIWLQRLAAGKVEPGLKLDVLETASAFSSLTERIETYQRSRTTAPRDDLMDGGNIALGKEIVTNHLGANCLACHKVEASEGSQVGPSLKSIGAQRKKTEILESLMNPVAKIVPGYGLVSITLKDGSNHAGALYREDANHVILKLADGSEKKLLRAQIAMQTPPVSMMPPMLGILTARELRDVIAYLSSLKPSKRSKAKSEH